MPTSIAFLLSIRTFSTSIHSFISSSVPLEATIGRKESKMWSPSLVALPFLVRSLVSAAGTTTPQCPTYNGQLYLDANGVNYTIYCGADTSPGDYATVTATSLDACLAACDAQYSSSNCQVVTYDGGSTCYLKRSFSSTTSNSNLVSAVRFVPPPPYPVPQANYVNASSGCGTALSSSITPGGASVNMTFVSPDGLTRWYLIHVPKIYDINKAAPLIMSFHGRSSDPVAHESETGYSLAKWNPYGIVVYPSGIQVGTKLTRWRVMTLLMIDSNNGKAILQRPDHRS